MRLYIVPRWGTTRLRDVSHAEVQAWVTELLAGGLSASSVQRTHGLLSQMLDLAVRDRRLPALTPHGLRHTAASLANAAGGNVKVVQQMLGHATAIEGKLRLFNRRPWASKWALTCGDMSGPGRARTDDHRGVNAVLYQLSYRPQTAIRAASKLVSQPNRSAP